MADPTQNQYSVNPELADLLTILKRNIFLNINCHHIGIIDSFNPENQTANILIAYKKIYVNTNQDGTKENTLVDYAPLLDVPVIVLCGGQSSLTFPIQKGDECLILFNDRDFESWFESGNVLTPNSTRLHAYSDAIALVGLKSLRNSLKNYDTTRIVLQNQNSYIGLGPQKIRLKNDVENLFTITSNLIDVIRAITTDPVMPGVPATVSPESQMALEMIKNRLSNLLE